ncbi:Conserved_hypothetical protein [Hexamita inflata]|uniref:Uncharacterized protein n=1 Tax=Hexamita inflata TaxID=28002 RepID=A0AA86PM55_9EUKA|nr:Conserved hypothetical protein [Hexamita inflata]
MTLEDCTMLMNVLKCYPDEDLFLQVGQRVIRVFDGQMQVKKEFPIIPQDPKQYDHHIYCQGYILAQNGQQYHTVINDGIIYVQILHAIYILEDLTLKFLCDFPSTSGQTSGLRGEIFSLNNKLYAFNHGSFFVYENNKFKFYKHVLHFDFQNRMQQYIFCSFAENLFCITQYTINRVHDDLSFEVLYQGASELEYLIPEGGIIMMAPRNSEDVVAINMLSFQVIDLQRDRPDIAKKFVDIVKKSHKDFSALTASYIKESEEIYNKPRKLNAIQQLFYFGDCGLQLKPEYQKLLFGEDFPELCKQKYNAFMKTKINARYVQETMKFLKEVKSDISYECDPEPQITEKYLHKCQLLNVMKLSPKLDVYMAVEDGFIHIIDYDMKVLHQIEVDFDYYAGSVQFSDPQRKQGLTKILTQNAVIFKEDVYFQVFNQIYKLSRQQLNFVSQLPYSSNEIFETNPQSLCCSCNSIEIKIGRPVDRHSVYKLHNNQLKYSSMVGAFEYQFAGHTVLWYEMEQKLCIIQNSLEKDLVIPPQSCTISFCQSGIIILLTCYCQNIYVVDCINGRIKELVDDFRFCEENILNYVALGGAGIQLKDEILVELFDADFPAQIRRVYDEYLEKCVQEYPGLGVQLNQLIESAKDQLPQDYESRLNVIPETKIAKKPKLEILNDFQLMNVVKLRADLDLYLAVEDNYIYIVNQEQKIFGKYWVNYDMYPGYHSEKYYEGQLISNFSCQYQSIIFNGEIYIQKFECVYKICNNKLVFVASIPGYNQKAVKISVYFNSGLYVHDNQLFAFTDSGNVFKLQDKQFVYQFNDDKRYYQFCDQVIAYDRCSNQFQTIDGQTLFDLNVKNIFFVINQGGVLIFTYKPKDQDPFKYFIIDHVNKQVKVLESQQLQDYTILCSSKILGPAGIEVKQTDVLNILGNDAFRKQVYDYYSQFIRKQELNENWVRETGSLLSFKVLKKYYAYFIGLKFIYYSKQLKQVSKFAKQMIKFVDQKVQQVVSDAQVSIERFNSIFNQTMSQ